MIFKYTLQVQIHLIHLLCYILEYWPKKQPCSHNMTFYDDMGIILEC